MGSFNAAFFVGLLAAVPLSVTSNLLTPRIRTYFERRAAASADARAKSLRKRLLSVEAAEANNNPPSELLIEAVVTAAFASAIGAVGAGLCFSAVSLLTVVQNPIRIFNHMINLWLILQVMATLISALTGLVVINILSSARNRAADLRNSRVLKQELEELERHEAL